MGKNSPAFVLKTVFKDISNIENVIKDCKTIEETYEKVDFKDEKEVKKIVEDTKQLVICLKDEAIKISDYFKQNYKKWGKKLEKITSENHLNCKENGTNVESETEKVEANENLEKNKGGSENNIEAITNEEQSQAASENTNEQDEDLEKNKEKENNIEIQTNKEQSQKNDSQNTNEQDEDLEKNKESSENNIEIQTNEAQSQKNDSENTDEQNKKGNGKNSSVVNNAIDNKKSGSEDSEKNKKANKTPEEDSEDKTDDDNSGNGNQDDRNSDSSESDEDDSSKGKNKKTVEEVREPKVFLKCVDITKLVDKPQKKKSLETITISDSDNDDKPETPVKKRKRVSFAADCKKSDGVESSPKSKFRQANNESPFNNKRKSDSPIKKKKPKTDLLKEKELSDSNGTNSESNSDDSDIMIVESPKKTVNKPTKSMKKKNEKEKEKKNEKENKNVKENKKEKENKNENLNLDAQTDKKFSYKTYVPLPRTECEKLLQIYLNNKEISEIKRLTDLKSLESPRKSKKKMRHRSSSSDSDNAKPKAKKAKVSSKKSHNSDSDKSSSSDDEKSGNNTNEMDVTTIPGTPEKSTDNLDVEGVHMILNTIRSDSEKSTNESDADDEDEETENKKKSKKQKGKKFKENNKSDSDDDKSGDKKEAENKKRSKKDEGKKSKESSKSDSNDDDKSGSEKESKSKEKGKKSKGGNKSDSSDEDNSDDGKEKKKKKSKKNNKSDSSDEDKSDDGKEKKKKESKKNNKSDSSDEDKSDDGKEKKKKKSKKNNKSDSSDEDKSDDGKEKKKKESKKKKNSSSEKSSNTSEESDKENDSDKKKKKKWRKDKLLTTTISDTDSDVEFVKTTIDRSRLSRGKKTRSAKKFSKIIDSDSGSNTDSKKNNKDDDFKPRSSSSDSDSGKSESGKEQEKEQTKKKSRIRRLQDSSDDDDKSTRKTIRKLLAHESLAETTKQAEKDERERKARIAERQKKYNQIFESNKPKDATVDKVVLDFDEKTKEEIISVNEDLVKKLKPHQAKGIQFMWDACYESVERIKKTDGSGCILAHCMGLGKTLQVIALIHTAMRYAKVTKVEKVLVVCPLNTVLNWVSEFEKWLDDVDEPEIEVYDLVSCKQNYDRQDQVEQWTRTGGVLVMGYDMFRNLTNPTNKRIKKSQREAFQKHLVNPGADLVICDEGHLLKNEKTNLSIAMNRIHTLRRIVLTGTPMQNNLKEYYCMVQFVKPNLLGTYKEYLNRFVNPITNGQYTDSTPHDINIMRKRSHVLHKMLDGLVQRKDYSVLTPYLPPKYEYVLFLTLTETQIKLYRHYLTEFSRKPSEGKMRTTFLFTDFQEFQRICTHPRVLLLKSEEDDLKRMFLSDDEESEGSLKDFIDDKDDTTSDSSSADSSDDKKSGSDDEKNKKKKGSHSGSRLTRSAAAATEIIDLDEVPPTKNEHHWWSQFCDGSELDNIALSSKLYVLFTILQECELIGDKLLVFSQSLYSLNIIEYFLSQIDEATQKEETDKTCGFSGSWANGLDYFRLDGSSSCDNRSAWCKSFNSPDNSRARLFLISTRAGGLGINLVGANRVVIFDVSWNPSHDIQSIYRIYRFGQTKPCYIYRFVTNGTMEMKIYERQVTKQAISKRVIDEQQIDRHYNQTDLSELYNFDPNPTEQPTPLIPQDVLLAELLQKEKDKIFKYHEHQTLLENKEDEELDEAERKAAWEEYENEKTAQVLPGPAMSSTGGWIKNLPLTAITTALNSIVQKDNSTWTPQQVQSVIPVIVQQLREQVEKGETVLFNRIVTELKLLQATQQQRVQEYYMQQHMRMLQQMTKMRDLQQQQQRIIGVQAASNTNGPPVVSAVVDLED